MKNVDTSKVWQGKRKPEKLEMKGFSSPQSTEPAKNEKVVIRKKRSKSVKATKKPLYHDTIEIIRKAVKDYGKEAATHRFTLDEKKAIAEIIFNFNGRDIKTSENEITRIAVNFVIQDYKENGNKSICIARNQRSTSPEYAFLTMLIIFCPAQSHLTLTFSVPLQVYNYLYNT